MKHYDSLEWLVQYLNIESFFKIKKNYDTGVTVILLKIYPKSLDLINSEQFFHKIKMKKIQFYKIIVT